MMLLIIAEVLRIQVQQQCHETPNPCLLNLTERKAHGKECGLHKKY